MRFTEAPHIRELIREGTVTVVPVEISRDFGNYVDLLPLLKPLEASIDWTRMPAHKSIHWYDVTDDEMVTWARSLRIGRFSRVVVWYNRVEPSLCMPFEFGLGNLDILTWGASGPRYVFGAETDGKAYECAFEALLETTGGPLVYGVV